LAVSNGSPIDCNISHLLSRECIPVWSKGRLAGNSLNVCNNFRLGQLILRSSDPVRLKIEGGMTNIETTENGSTEVLGGLVYPVCEVPTENVSFILNESRGSFIYYLCCEQLQATGS